MPKKGSKTKKKESKKIDEEEKVEVCYHDY